MTLVGYLDRMSAAAGSSVDCMISSTIADVEVDVIRLLHGDTNAAGPGPQVAELDLPAQHVVATEQQTWTGSCVVVDGLTGASALSGVSFSVLLQPTLAHGGRRQVVMSLLDVGDPVLVLAVDESGSLVVETRSSAVGIVVGWRRDTWYRAEVSTSDEDVTLRLVRVVTRPDGVEHVVVGEGRGAGPGRTASYDSVVIGAQTCTRTGRRWAPSHCFNGRVENPVLRSAGGTIVGDWRFERQQQSTVAEDASGNDNHGVVVNAPTRAVTGHRWARRVVDSTRAPEQYAAIHLHEDDLDDAGWDVGATVELPPDLASGVYGVRLRAGDEEDVIPFAVVPGPASVRARVAVLLPTFTYVAYANERMVDRLDFEGEALTDHPVTPGPYDLLLRDHPEWGLSHYDIHADGTTCVFSTSLRPVPNLRADYRAWLQDAPRHLGADLYLVHWLKHLGQEVDIITDHDLHSSPRDLLDAYDVVITGSHPEYVSEQILDSLESHLDGGGSLMYLGGNGFYWVTSQDPLRPHLLEVRRGPAGTRPSEGAAWEGVHSTTGEPGGLWRTRGRSPNRLTGVGMTAQGWDEKAPGYARMPDSHLPEAAFLFDGIGEDEVIGDFGLIMNGASGDELDRFDISRGSPEDTLVVARSTGHSDYYQLAGEDLLATRPGVGGAECEDVRSDMTLRRHEGGGWVFSVGSIAFTGSISHQGYDNNVAKLLGNALAEFLRTDPERTT